MSVEKWWNEICCTGSGKREKLREKPIQTTFSPPRNPHGVSETRPTTCRERELTLVHTKKWRAFPDERTSQCWGHLRNNTNMKDDTRHPLTHYSNKANMKGWLWRLNDIWGPCGSKASWHLSYRTGKIPKKPHPGNLSPPGIEPEPTAWQARTLPRIPHRCTWLIIWR